MYKATFEDENRELTIEHDEAAGYYLVVNDLKSNKSIADHLCDSFEEALLEAEELYGIDRHSFEKS